MSDREKKGNNWGLMASRRLATTAARLPSVAASNTAQFPPQQSLYEKSDIPKAAFDPEAWAATQPPPPSALIAFAHRLGLSTIMNTPEMVQMTCTHPSFLPLHCRVFPDAPRPQTNGQLSELGNALMGMFTSEFVHAAYPYLPTRVWVAATTAYVGPRACANVAREMGATPLLRWQRTVCPYSSILFDLLSCLLSRKKAPYLLSCTMTPLLPSLAPLQASSTSNVLSSPPANTFTPTSSVDK